MPIFSYIKKTLHVKVVYYGPGLCGKTTNLDTIHAGTPDKHRGPLSTLSTETDRTLFFDYMPVEVGYVGGFITRLQIYTVPGQVFYNDTRKIVLKNVDCVVFVADSQREMLAQNLESLQNLRENLAEDGVDLDTLPMVIQYNKRDLPDIMTVEELEAALNPRKLPAFEAVAVRGDGVFETLRQATRSAIARIRAKHMLPPDTSSDVLSVLTDDDFR